jgi:hypothetical protein
MACACLPSPLLGPSPFPLLGSGVIPSLVVMSTIIAKFTDSATIIFLENNLFVEIGKDWSVRHPLFTMCEL